MNSLRQSLRGRVDRFRRRLSPSAGGDESDVDTMYGRALLWRMLPRNEEDRLERVMSTFSDVPEANKWADRNITTAGDEDMAGQEEIYKQVTRDAATEFRSLMDSASGEGMAYRTETQDDQGDSVEGSRANYEARIPLTFLNMSHGPSRTATFKAFETAIKKNYKNGSLDGMKFRIQRLEDGMEWPTTAADIERTCSELEGRHKAGTLSDVDFRTNIEECVYGRTVSLGPDSARRPSTPSSSGRPGASQASESMTAPKRKRILWSLKGAL